MKYGFIRAHQDQFRVSRMCVVLKSVAMGITTGETDRSPNGPRRTVSR